jgi:hypothetical protein
VPSGSIAAIQPGSASARRQKTCDPNGLAFP